MNILVTGRGGKAGSWAVRAEQLGKAIGAMVLPNALDVAAFDLAIIVKRTPPDLVQRIHAAGVPLVWDIVDAYPQPIGNAWDRYDCMGWLRGQVGAVKPAAIVAATEAMALDCAAFGVPVLALPHHARPGLARTPIRPLKFVGYEGSIEHLGNWLPWLQTVCRESGLQFDVNPASINNVDVLVALREVNGYAPLHWKSNVKLANAQASGTPIICAREAGYLETARGGVCWADTPLQVQAALDYLTPMQARHEAAQVLAGTATTLEQTAAKYLAWLRTLA